MTAARRRAKVVKLGSAHFHARAGQQLVVPVTLARRGRWRVLRGHKVRCRVTVTTRTAAGRTTTSTSTTTLTFRRQAHPTSNSRKPR